MRRDKAGQRPDEKNRKALIVVNVLGFLHFLWNDIYTLQEMGYEVTVAADGRLPDGSEAAEIRKMDDRGVMHYQIDFDTKNPWNRTNFLAYRQLKKVLKNNYDLIHCHTPIAGILTRLAAIRYRKKGALVLYTTHGFAFTDHSSRKAWILYYTVEWMMSFLCDAIITINHEDYDNARKMHCKKVFIIPSVGLDNRRFQNVPIDRNTYRRQFGAGQNDVMILAVGELSSRKNHQIIIRALALLPDKDRYVYVICGKSLSASPELEKRLRRLAEENGVRLFLAGHRRDIPEVNACADIAVIPSIREGFGMAGVEAMASGVPVIGSDVQGIREYVIPEKTGYLCDPDSAEEFAEAIEKLVSLTPEERGRISQNCKRMAAKFDTEESKKAVKKIYADVLKEKD